MVLFAGVIAVIVGVAGLLVPVSVGEQHRIGCGSPVATDLSEARAHDDGTAANIPVLDEVIVDTDYTRLCDMELSDRRVWTITVAAAGLLAIAGVAGWSVLSKRRGNGGGGRESNPPATGSATQRF